MIKNVTPGTMKLNEIEKEIDRQLANVNNCIDMNYDFSMEIKGNLTISFEMSSIEDFVMEEWDRMLARLGQTYLSDKNKPHQFEINNINITILIN